MYKKKNKGTKQNSIPSVFIISTNPTNHLYAKKKKEKYPKFGQYTRNGFW
jgi:hypothetical protein